jgi:hypothetical protein
LRVSAIAQISDCTEWSQPPGTKTTSPSCESKQNVGGAPEFGIPSAGSHTCSNSSTQHQQQPEPEQQQPEPEQQQPEQQQQRLSVIGSSSSRSSSNNDFQSSAAAATEQHLPVLDDPRAEVLHQFGAAGRL